MVFPPFSGMCTSIQGWLSMRSKPDADSLLFIKPPRYKTSSHSHTNTGRADRVRVYWPDMDNHLFLSCTHLHYCLIYIVTVQYSKYTVVQILGFTNFLVYLLVFHCVLCLSLQILVLELNDEAAEQTVEAKVVDLLQGQEGFRWKVMTTVGIFTIKGNALRIGQQFQSCNILQIISYILYHPTVEPGQHH